MEKEHPRTEGTATTRAQTDATAQPARDAATRPQTPLQKVEGQQRQADAITEELKRQQRERVERERQQVEDELQRQQERDGGLER
jgi:hypothetical protein